MLSIEDRLLGISLSENSISYISYMYYIYIIYVISRCNEIYLWAFKMAAM